ncbi:MAG TPA: 2-polyprenylphenol 6-hydroxylase [Nitrospiraceae bacterium]|nr:2-polyprenylphenol 6-hydroxylase [Nitrospiraceae bacterium]
MSLLGFWRRHYRDIPRIRYIIMVASRYGFGHIVEQMGLQRFVSFGRRVFTFRKYPQPDRRRSAPERLRVVFEELGPSFIKLGQVLACRSDMLPTEYAQELCKLTDSVNPFPFAKVKEIVEKELDAPISRVFAEFDPRPEAAASIAQVHRARLTDGTEVMVKVQRPDIDRIIDRDISILRGLAELIEAYIPEMAVYNPPGIVEEFARTITRELDFFVESSNAVQLRNNFEESPILYVPRVFPHLTSRRVLVIEKLDGIRIDEYERIVQAGFDRREISQKGAAAYFQMIFQDGFFHGDPHPGNIFVLPDGRLGVVDFGIMGRVTDENMEYFADTIVALVNRDFNSLVQQYMNLGFVSDEIVDIERFQRDLREDLAELFEPYYGMTVKQIDFGGYVDRLTQLSLRHGLKMPQNLYVVNKTLVTLEGILRQLDPDLDFIEVAKPHVSRLIRRKKDPLRALRSAQKSAEDFYDVFSHFPRQLQAGFRKFMRGDVQIKLRHEELDRLIRDIDRSSNRLSFSVITAAIIVGSSIIIHSGQGTTMFGLPIGFIGYVIAALFGVWLLIGILRSGQL